MKLVRFLSKAYVDGRMWLQGEEGLIDDRHVLGAHMVDVETEQSGAAVAANDAYLARLAHPERVPEALGEATKVELVPPQAEAAPAPQEEQPPPNGG